MKKRFKSKKKIKFGKTIKFILIIIILFLSFYIFKYYLLKIKLTTSNEEFIKNILSNSNYYSYYELDNNNVINKIINYIDNNLFNKPLTILENEFNYRKQNTEIMVNENKIEKPLVYIYNSHQGETYDTKYLEEYNIVPDVLMASKMLKEKLENNNINTIVEESDILAYMKSEGYDHSDSYIASRTYIEKAMNKYDSIKLYIDLHRDAASHDATYAIIDNKPCAKVLFVIGLEYDTYEDNLNIVNRINNIIVTKYPSLTRGIMKKKGYGVNGVYNQDLDSKVILIEIGGNENTIEEVNNTLDIVASVLGEYLNEKK